MRRLVARRVNEDEARDYAVAQAVEKGRPVIHARHGGTVANSYGYRAETECVVTVGYPDGHYWQSAVERIPANKATLAGVFRACTGFGGLFDRRYSDEAQAQHRAELLAWIEENYAGRLAHVTEASTCE